jgi:uncharacterized iron-regulated protein
MRKNQLIKLCALSLGIFLFSTTPAYPQSASTISQLGIQQLTQPQILQELGKANVIYLGEIHDSPEDHKAQLKILQALHQKNPKIAIAMEMFQRPYQDILDKYLTGQITEAQLIELTEYEKRWVFPWEYYAPVLRFAKINQLSVLALNTPTEVSRKVARQGLESLTESERQYIPSFSEIRTDNADYRKMVQESYEQHQQSGQGNSRSFERFFATLVLWDETMAEAIAQFIQRSPDYQVVVLAGKSHIIYGYGIPSRVARRLNNKQLVQKSVLLSVSAEDKAEAGKKIADYFWQD